MDTEIGEYRNGSVLCPEDTKKALQWWSFEKLKGNHREGHFKFITGDISKNGRVRTFKNYHLHKSNKKSGKTLSESTFSELRNLTKGLQQYRKCLFKKNN